MSARHRLRDPAERPVRTRPPIPEGSYMLVRADRLRARMAEAGMSYVGLGEAAGVDPSFVSHLLPPEIEVPGPGQRRCGYHWQRGTGPQRCVGAEGHKGRHAVSTRARRRSCSPATAQRIADALRTRTDVLFELRGPEDPSTGDLDLRAPIVTSGGRHSIHEQEVKA